MAENPSWATPGRWVGRRGMSTAAGGVIMLVVILIVGAGGYFAFNNAQTTGTGSSNTTSKSSCQPVTSPICGTITAATHDVSLFVPYNSAQSGSVVPFTASVPASDGTPTNYLFDFGDGTNSSQTTSTANHAYTSPGTYLVSVVVTIAGLPHDNYHSLGAIGISASFTSADASEQPGVSGTILANTSSTTAPTAILSPGGWISVSGRYTGSPTNPNYVPQAPTITASSSGAVANLTGTNSTAAATVTFASAGVYWVQFAGSAVSLTDPTDVVAQSYTFTVIVAPSGVNAGSTGAVAQTSPHQGELVVYEYIPGGSSGEDPAIDYETAGYEPILNVYQTLIAYNGSAVGPSYQSYIPEIAACVPGSDQGANNCQSLFGSTLVNGSDYTFVISGSASFYDPATTKSWGVYPTDVLFSVARTMGFAVQPCFGCNNGWILTQSLLSSGTGWESGLHGARNNTPQNVYNSMTLNGSDCPAAAMQDPYHGCVTFHANGNGLNWPYFLELIGDGLGGSIVPCGWFSADAQGAGIPYWTAGNVTDAGDHPCAAPGTTGWGLAPSDSSLPITGWDNWETAGSSPPFVGNVQYEMVGSGPYYMNQLVIGNSYSLAANPAYTGNPLCTWTGCQPQAGHFAGTVSVTWETSQLPGEEAYQNHIADFASIPVPDTGLRLQLIQQGVIHSTTFPSISIDFMPFNFAFNVAAAQHYTSNPISVSSDVFSYSGLRQFIVHAYPYDTIQSTINIKDGLEFAFNYGGVIPKFMSNYYPTNVTWPSGDPSADAATQGTAAWWWAQVNLASSPYYDPELASCTAANPCQFPLFGETGAPDLDQRIALWAAEINSLSGGALRANPLDINFIDLVINSLYSGAYQNAMPLFRLGWAPDYPDPTDYMVPMWMPDSSYTLSDSVWEQTQLAQFNSSSCHPWSDWTGWAAMATTDGGIATDCQGAAYSAMVLGMKLAAVMPDGPARVAAYATVEQIGNALALYAYTFQQNVIASSAAWVDQTSINNNITIGGGADQTWWQIAGNGVWSSG